MKKKNIYTFHLDNNNLLNLCDCVECISFKNYKGCRNKPFFKSRKNVGLLSVFYVALSRQYCANKQSARIF